MSKRKTHEEYVRELSIKVPHVRVMGAYVNSRTPIAHHCTKHNITWDVSPFNLLQHPNGCELCQQEVLENNALQRRKTNDQFLEEVQGLNSGIVPLGEYSGTHSKLLFQCKDGHTWQSTPHDILDGYGCPYCAGNKVLKGFNDLWTTNPDIAVLLKDHNVGYEISRGSHRKVDWVCPSCGAIKNDSPKQVYDFGLACPKCSDGISYPNRLIRSLMDQLPVQSFQPEWSPEWIGRYRYDMYFVYNDNEYIIEMDGGIGHGGIDFATNSQDVDGLERDTIKDKQAKLHNIKLIRIDCRYEQDDIRNRFGYIKQSILDSELRQIFNLINVDWDLCNRDATKSLHILAAEKYDSGIGIADIANELHVHYSTVYEWLKRMSKEGLCSYKPVIGAHSHQKNRIKQ